MKFHESNKRSQPSATFYHFFFLFQLFWHRCRRHHSLTISTAKIRRKGLNGAIKLPKRTFLSYFNYCEKPATFNRLFASPLFPEPISKISSHIFSDASYAALDSLAYLVYTTRLASFIKQQQRFYLTQNCLWNESSSFLLDSWI